MLLADLKHLNPMFSWNKTESMGQISESISRTFLFYTYLCTYIYTVHTWYLYILPVNQPDFFFSVMSRIIVAQ